MVNFRVKEQDLVRIDEAAERTRQSRSDFIRTAVSEAVQTRVGGGAVTKVGVRGKATEKAQMLDEGCPKNRYCVFTKIPGGTICSTCGVTR